MHRFVAVALAVSTSFNPAYCQDAAGSNLDGREKVCYISSSAATELGIAEVLKACRRGDILEIGWISPSIAVQLCDFTKAVIYHPPKGIVFACVYTGFRRPITK